MAQPEAIKATAQEKVPADPRAAASLAPGSFLGFLARGAGIFKDEKNRLNIKSLNFAFFLVAGVLSLYYANSIKVSIRKVENIDLAKFVNFKDGGSGDQQESLLKPLSFYAEALEERDIFRMGKKSDLDTPEVISSKAAEASQALKMVGISWSDSPDAMIEDTRTGKTYFVKSGQMVGDFQVVAIYKDKVTLRYGAENIDLR